MGVENYYDILKGTFLFIGILMIIGSIGIYFLGVISPSDETAANLAGIAVVLFVIGIILLITGKKIPKYNEPTIKSPKYFQCEFCYTYFEKEVEKLNHYRICEKRKKEEPDSNLD